MGHRRAERAPQPTTADLLAQLIARVEEADRAAEARHAEVLARLDALDRAVSRAEDAAGCADLSVEELRGRTREWSEQLLNQLLDAIEGEPGD
jgi:hypothetical protein